MVMTIVMTMVVTMVMTIVIVIVMETIMIGTLPFPKQQYTPEEGASETTMNSRR